jgi:hypothetical protein
VGVAGRFALHPSADGWKGADGEEKYRDARFGRVVHSLACGPLAGGVGLGIDRKTIRKYLAPAIAAGMEPGGEPLSAEQWAELIDGWFPELNDPAARSSTWPLIAPHHDRIKAWLGVDVTVATIAQRLRDDHGVAASESSVRRWTATHFADEVTREKVTVPRGPVAPGSEAQIDYGRLGMWFDPATAKRVAVWAFVMVLACSRHLFVRPVIRMDQTTWCACHVAAFEFFCGVPAPAGV